MLFVDSFYVVCTHICNWLRSGLYWVSRCLVFLREYVLYLVSNNNNECSHNVVQCSIFELKFKKYHYVTFVISKCREMFYTVPANHIKL